MPTFYDWEPITYTFFLCYKQTRLIAKVVKYRKTEFCRIISSFCYKILYLVHHSVWHKRPKVLQQWRTFVQKLQLKPGVGNSFGFAGHIRDNLGIRGPVYVHVNWFQDCLYDIFLFLCALWSTYSYLENFKWSWRATLRCLASRMWPADRTLPSPGLNHFSWNWWSNSVKLLNSKRHWT